MLKTEYKTTEIKENQVIVTGFEEIEMTTSIQDNFKKRLTSGAFFGTENDNPHLLYNFNMS